MSSSDINSVLDKMSYSQSLSGFDLYENWISKRPNKTCFLKNAYQDENNFDSLCDPLYLEDSRNAMNNEDWKDAVKRATLLFKLSQAVEKQNNLFSCVESGISKKPLVRSKERDIPELVEHLSTAARSAPNCPESWEPYGVVGVLVEDTNSPSLCQSLQLGPALAAGNAVVLCLANKTCHTAFLLAETARDVGFPVGILSVACCVPCYIIDSFDLVLGYGIHSPEIFSSKLKWKFAAKPKAIVTEKADIASAAHGIIQLACFNSPMSPSSGAIVLVQESIYDVVWKEISSVFKRLVPSNSVFADNGDYYFKSSCLDDTEARKKNISDAESEGAEVVFPENRDSGNLCDAPVLVRNIRPTSPLFLNESCAGSQIIWMQSFRHAKEAVTLANGFPFTDHVSIWGEQASILLDVARDVKASNVWMNTQNILDTAGEYDTSIFLSKAGPKGAKCESQTPCISNFDRAQFSREVTSAVTSARNALKKWSGMGPKIQLQLLFELANKFQSQEEALYKIAQSNSISKDIGQLFKCASQNGISGYKTKSNSSSAVKCWSWDMPHGVLGVVLPSSGTLLALLSSVGAALAAGNALVAVLPNKALTPLCREVFSGSGMPNGMVCLLDADDRLDGPAEVLLAANIDAAWILTSQSNVCVKRPDMMSGTLPISYLDLSQYDWQSGSIHATLREWLQKQSTIVKKIWFESASSI